VTLTMMFLRNLGRWPFLLGVLAGAGALAGCSSTRLLDAITPAGRYTSETDIAYGPAPRQRLDIYHPQNGATPTVIVFFYGGGWRTGEKADYRFVAEALARHGIAVVIPDYRLVPAVRFPAFVEDGAAAVRATRERFGPDAKIYVMGHSAGGHIAALLALDPRYLAAVGLNPRDLAGLIGIAGPLDFLPITTAGTAQVFEGIGDLATTQPVTYAGAQAPRTLLLHGTDDRIVLPRNSRRLAARLQEAGAPVTLVEYPNLGHVEIMLGLSSTFAGNSRLMSDLLEFLDRP
jgi:acetyl esterase/lipase